MKPKYYYIQDAIYSHITKGFEDYDGHYSIADIQEFDSFTKAKKALIQHLKTMNDEYKYALQKARSLRKSDLEED